MYKKISIIFFSICVIFLIFSIPVFADPPGASEFADLNNWQVHNSHLVNAGNKVIGLVYYVCSIASIGVLMVVGIKYMLSSPDDRASIKSRAIPYVVGAIMVFSAVNIMRLVATMAEWIK